MSEGSNLQVIATELVVAATGKPRIFCQFCCVSFGTRGNLYCHLRKFHQIPVKMRGTQICGLCDKKVRTIALLHDHLQNQHSITLKFVDETFYSRKDFQEWKNKIEKESLSSFVLRNSTDNKESGITFSYYICHRSGQFKTKQNRIRHVKSSGSIKSGSTCPAVMRVCTETVDGISEIKVQYQSVHIGHDLETRTLRLTKEDRANLASCLKLGISMDKILEQAKQNFSPTNRYSFLTRKHLHNIRRDFGIPSNIKKTVKASTATNNNVEASDNSIGYEIEASDNSIGYEDGFEIEVSNHIEIQDSEKMQEHERIQEHEKNTAVSSLLLLQNDNYSEDFKNRKAQIVNQLKELQLRIERWDPACPLPDAEEHIRALNAVLDISASSNGILHLDGTLPVIFEDPTIKPKTRRRKATTVKKGSKKNSVSNLHHA